MARYFLVAATATFIMNTRWWLSASDRFLRTTINVGGMFSRRGARDPLLKSD
jgi:hypothetical protein